MTNFVAEQSLIKKYKSLPALLKALGKTEEDYKSLAKKKTWSTVSFSGQIEEYECTLTFFIRLNKKTLELEVDTPKLSVLNWPHKSRANPAVVASLLALANERF